jgi:hypothetical protein
MMHGGNGTIEIFQYPNESPEIKSVLYHDLRDFLPLSVSGYNTFLQKKLRDCFLANEYGLTNWKVFNPRGNGACMINAVFGAYGYNIPTESDCANELKIGLKNFFSENTDVQNFSSTRLDGSNNQKLIIFQRNDSEELLELKFIDLLSGTNLGEDIMPLICYAFNCELIQLQHEIIDSKPYFFVYRPTHLLKTSPENQLRKIILLVQNGHYVCIFSDYKNNVPDAVLFDMIVFGEFWGQVNTY